MSVSRNQSLKKINQNYSFDYHVKEKSLQNGFNNLYNKNEYFKSVLNSPIKLDRTKIQLKKTNFQMIPLNKKKSMKTNFDENNQTIKIKNGNLNKTNISMKKSSVSELNIENLKNLIKEKIVSENEVMIKNNELKANSKRKIEELQKIIEMSTNNLKENEKPKESEIKRLKNLIEIRSKELIMNKQQISNYVSQKMNYENLIDDKSANEKINELEIRIKKIQGENTEFQKKIKESKIKSQIYNRDLITYKNEMDYNTKINLLSDEIKGLAAKKHDYSIKIGKNTKSVENVKNYLSTVKLMIENFEKQNENKNLKDEILMISSYLSTLSSELEGNPQEILEKVNKNTFIIKDLFDRKKMHSTSPKREEKYQIKTDVPVFPLIVSKKGRNMSAQKTDNRKENFQISNDKIHNHSKLNNIKKYNIYENSIETDEHIDIDYQELIYRKAQLENLNFKILKNYDENLKIYEKKFKEMEEIIFSNQQKLEKLIQINQNTSDEINELTALLSICQEENMFREAINNDVDKLYNDIEIDRKNYINLSENLKKNQDVVEINESPNEFQVENQTRIDLNI